MSSSEIATNTNRSFEPAGYWNPYLSGALIGLVLIASYCILGTGVGASAGPARMGAQLEQWMIPAHVNTTEYFAGWGDHPLAYYLVFMLVGTFVGGLGSALLARRVRFGVERRVAFAVVPRLLLAGIGGILVGFASRLARGCTSGQALSGGALLLTGSLIFVACLFVGGYSTPILFRRQWND